MTVEVTSRKIQDQLLVILLESNCPHWRHTLVTFASFNWRSFLLVIDFPCFLLYIRKKEEFCERKKNQKEFSFGTINEPSAVRMKEINSKFQFQG